MAVTLRYVSDVWQGPGWWLASDGKWYPADAEPGAVYDGELDAPAATAPATEGMVAPESVQVDQLEMPSRGLPTQIGAPTKIESGPTAAPATNGVSHDTTNGVSHDSVSAAMPAPLVDSPQGGGWEVIEPAPSVEEAIVEDAIVNNDGWTSAYDDRQGPGDDLGLASLTDTSVPEVDAPELDLPEFSETSFETPDFAKPDFAAPDFVTPEIADISDIPAPDLAAPEALDLPEMAVPEMDLPEVDIPDIEAPEVTVPDMDLPDVDVPDIEVPAADLAAPEIPDLPEMAIPEVDVPDTDVPEIHIPDIEAPEVTVPDMDVPEIEAPEIPDTPNLGVIDPTVTETITADGDASPWDTPLAAPSTEAPLETPDVGRNARTPTPVVERNDAWRKPGEQSTTDRSPDAAAATAAGIPEVVDLAVPQEKVEVHEPESSSRSRFLLTAAVIIAAVVGLAILIAQLASGLGDDDTVTGDNAAQQSPETTIEDSTSSADAADTTGAAQPADPDPVVPIDDDSKASVFELRAGDCIVGDIGAGQVTEVMRVECETEHTFEVFREALIPSTITEFNEVEISTYAEDVCRSSFTAYVGPDAGGLSFKFLQPTEDSWNQDEEPDRVITCLLFDENGLLTGRAG